MRTLLLMAAMLLATVSTAKAEVLSPVTDETALAECGDCHMAYPPILLPQASWENMMSDLSDHFGEDASLDAPTVKVVLDYYVKHSNDVVRAEQEILFEEIKKKKLAEGRSLMHIRPPGILRTAKKWSMKSIVPKRIQDLGRFKSKHSFSQTCKPMIDALMKRENVTSLGFCSGCHATMPIDGGSGIVFKRMLKMTPEEKRKFFTPEESYCLDE